MAQVVPYINFAGKTSEALEFYKSIFGGKADMTLAKDSPNAGQTPPEKMEQVFHADYKADGVRLLASDMMSDAAGRVVGNVYSMAVMCDSSEQLHDWYAKLVEGGKEVWAPRDSEWGSVYGQCVDRYGLQWMLNYDKAA